MIDATRLLSVQVTPEDYTYGTTAQATMTGTAQYDDAVTGWQPLPDYPVSVSAGSTDATVTTDSQAQFTWVYSPGDGDAWSAQVGDGIQYATSTASGFIHVAVPLTFESFSASLSRFGQLTARACVDVTAPGFNAPGGHMHIQYSAGSAGPWQDLGRIADSNMSLGTESCYKGSLPVRLASAYYRAYFPATVDYQAAASTAIQRWKYLTRIISLRVSPSAVRRHGKITVSGRLQTYNRKWRNLAGQQVLIVLKPKGSKLWYWIRKVRTSPSGHFTKTFTDPGSATWSADYEGNARHFACGGATHFVKVSAARAMTQSLGADVLPQLTELPAPLQQLTLGGQLRLRER